MHEHEGDSPGPWQRPKWSRWDRFMWAVEQWAVVTAAFLGMGLLIVLGLAAWFSINYWIDWGEWPWD